jgi:hypothetical protein
VERSCRKITRINRRLVDDYICLLGYPHPLSAHKIGCVFYFYRLNPQNFFEKTIAKVSATIQAETDAFVGCQVEIVVSLFVSCII